MIEIVQEQKEINNLALKLQLNKPLIGTINVSISGACSRSSNDNVPCPLQEQLKVSHCILIHVRSPIFSRHMNLFLLYILQFLARKK